MNNSSSNTSVIARGRVVKNHSPLSTRIGMLLMSLILSSLTLVASASAATITVGNAGDHPTGNHANCNVASTCTLRDAIAKAADAAGTATGDTIVFTLPANSTITLSGSELIVDRNLTIDGSAVSGLAISGNDRSRAFTVSSDATVTLKQLAITHGRVISDGGGILNYGTLALTNSVVLDNTSLSRGAGGIDNHGTLKLINSTVSGNTSNSSYGYGSGIDNSGTLALTGSTIASNSGNGIANSGTAILNDSAISANAGFGISNAGQLTLTNSSISSNAKGGILNSGTAKMIDGTVSDNTFNGIFNTGTLTLTNNTISDNAGSGIFNRDGTIALIGGTVSGNADGGIYNNGDTLTLINGVVSNNTTNRPGGGGGIDNVGILTLVGSDVSRNTAVNGGGGIWSSGQLALTNTTVSDNTAGYAGGIENHGTLVLTGSVVQNNTATNGCGGINNIGITQASVLTIADSTVSGNTSSNGGICNSYGTLTLINSTVANNAATVGKSGGIYTSVDFYNHSSTLTLTNSTLAGNTSSGVNNDIYNAEYSLSLIINTVIQNCAVDGSNTIALIDGGGNLDGGNGCGLTKANSKQNATLDLGALADNGGPTLTMQPGANSDAIGFGLPDVCRNAPVNSRDQRGYVRPAVGCTSGAVDPNASANDSIFYDGFALGGW